jgi:hypothetical protein
MCKFYFSNYFNTAVLFESLVHSMTKFTVIFTDIKLFTIANLPMKNRRKKRNQIFFSLTSSHRWPDLFSG